MIVGAEIAGGALLFPAGLVDPLGLGVRRRTKPVVMALQGFCLTIGVELGHASDVRLAADKAKFPRIEVQRGIYALGGAALRFPAVAGWGNAMRWLLTGDVFDAREVLGMGIVQEVVPTAELLDRATKLAERIAEQAPLAVRATLASARTAIDQGFEAEAPQLLGRARALTATEDSAEGTRSFVERRAGFFQGK